MPTTFLRKQSKLSWGISWKKHSVMVWFVLDCSLVVLMWKETTHLSVIFKPLDRWRKLSNKEHATAQWSMMQLFLVQLFQKIQKGATFFTNCWVKNNLQGLPGVENNLKQIQVLFVVTWDPLSLKAMRQRVWTLLKWANPVSERVASSATERHCQVYINISLLILEKRVIIVILHDSTRLFCNISRDILVLHVCTNKNKIKINRSIHAYIYRYMQMIHIRINEYKYSITCIKLNRVYIPLVDLEQVHTCLGSVLVGWVPICHHTPLLGWPRVLCTANPLRIILQPRLCFWGSSCL